MKRNFVLFCLLFLSSFLNAANIEVKPTKLFLSKKNKVTTLHVTNLSDTETLLQVSKFRWGQKKNEYILDKTNDLISSPAMFKLAPKQTQILRIGLRELHESEEEQPYRIILKEVHPQAVKDTMGLKIKLQISIPLFVKPDTLKNTKTDNDITWSVNTKDNKTIDITAKNNGYLHHTVHKFLFEDKNNKKDIKTFVYILPNNSFTWKFDKKDLKKGSYALNAFTDLGSISVSKDVTIK